VFGPLSRPTPGRCPERARLRALYAKVLGICREAPNAPSPLPLSQRARGAVAEIMKQIKPCMKKPLAPILAVAVAALFCATSSAAAPPTASRPNVLFIAIDDLRVNLGCYGDPAAITPNLDRLAARGTVFTRAYCQEAVCNPSRQSLLSGRRPDSIRVWDLNKLFRQTTPDVVPLPEHFKRNGYFAQSFGKIYHGTEGMNDPQSWSVPEQFAVVPKRDDYQLPENQQPSKSQKAAAVEFVDAPDDAYPDGKVAAAAVTALEGFTAAGTRLPFFLAVGFRKPHLPFTAPKRYWDMHDPAQLPPLTQAAAPRGAPALALHDSVELRGYTDASTAPRLDPDQVSRLRRGYYAAASFADAQVGRVLAALQRTGFATNTIVVVWGDNGYHLGEHGLWCKTTDYEADTRVPLIVATPDDRPRGVRTAALVELLDIYPTLIELCGLPPRAKLEGRSFAANLGYPDKPGRAAAISQFPRPWASGRNFRPEFMGYTVRSATHRYVEWRKLSDGSVMARELYAYRDEELFESENLADHPEEAGRLRELAAQLPPGRR
jgi:iduronate 2-sulfatase